MPRPDSPSHLRPPLPSPCATPRHLPASQYLTHGPCPPPAPAFCAGRARHVCPLRRALLDRLEVLRSIVSLSRVLCRLCLVLRRLSALLALVVPTVTRLPAAAVTNPLFESSAVSALVAELVEFAAACRLDYATSLVAESASASVCPPSVGGECALGTDVLVDRQEDFECFAAAVPHLVSMLLAPEGDPDAPDIPTLRSYAEAIEGPYSSQRQAAMDAEMASWKSTGTYVDEVPPVRFI
ncbi:unnamed protein product [Closterium sp. NIES-53]